MPIGDNDAIPADRHTSGVQNEPFGYRHPTGGYQRPGESYGGGVSELEATAHAFLSDLGLRHRRAGAHGNGFRGESIGGYPGCRRQMLTTSPGHQ